MSIFHVRLAQNHMATTFDFCVSCAKEEVRLVDSVLLEAHQLVADLELKLSEYLPQTAVFKLNRARVGERITASQHTLDLLMQSSRLEDQTEGAFSCVAKSKENLPLCDSIDWNATEIWKLHSGVHLGFGAIGKGYALDQVRLKIEQAGFSNFILSAGGSSLIISGFQGPDDPWTWGWNWQKSNSGTALGIPLQHLNGKTIALGISGMQEQGAHLVDPRSKGEPLSSYSPTLSSLVATPSAAEADALSTAAFIAGWEKSHLLFESCLPSPALAMIDHSGVPRWNGIFQKLWGPIAVIASSAVAHAEDSVDLNSMGLNQFAPYVSERHSIWVILPLLTLLLCLVHLKKNRRKFKGN